MEHIKHKMSTVKDYEYLLVARVISDLNMKKLDALREFEVFFFFL